jgi:hypothetical protein
LGNSFGLIGWFILVIYQGRSSRLVNLSEASIGDGRVTLDWVIDGLDSGSFVGFFKLALSNGCWDLCKGDCLDIGI